MAKHIYIQPKFEPMRNSNGMICSEADTEPAHFRLVVKRFSSSNLENPADYIMTPMAPVMISAIAANYPNHISAGMRGIKTLDGTAKGKTMVIAGAGYSLNAVRDRIPEKREDLIVVAINGALKALKPSQVDYYFALDWSSKKDWWDGYDTSRLIAVVGATVPPHLVQGFKNRVYFASNLFGLDKAEHAWLARELGDLEASKLATYSLMHLAYRMGCVRIIFVGHDFACTDGWYYWNERIKYDYANAQQMVIAQDMWGNATKTGPIMMRNCNVVMTSARFCEMDGITCINASEAGIMALPARCMPFERALTFVPMDPDYYWEV